MNGLPGGSRPLLAPRLRVARRGRVKVRVRSSACRPSRDLESLRQACQAALSDLQRLRSDLNDCQDCQRQACPLRQQASAQAAALLEALEQEFNREALPGEAC